MDNKFEVFKCVSKIGNKRIKVSKRVIKIIFHNPYYSHQKRKIADYYNLNITDSQYKQIAHYQGVEASDKLLPLKCMNPFRILLFKILIQEYTY